MKIQNDSMHALLDQGEVQRKSQASSADFGAVLARELQSYSAGSGMVQNAEQNVAALAMQIRSVQELGGSDAVGQTDAIYTEKVENLLDKWDLYSQALTRPDAASLKDVNSLLDNMSGELASLKAALPELGGDNSGLAGLVNELEVMTTTERIKFNRGDYV